MRQFYYYNGAERRGPVASDQLRELAAAGVIIPETIIECDGKRTVAGKVNGLFPSAPPIVAPPIETSESIPSLPEDSSETLNNARQSGIVKRFLSRITQSFNLLHKGGCANTRMSVWRISFLIIVFAIVVGMGIYLIKNVGSKRNLSKFQIDKEEFLENMPTNIIGLFGVEAVNSYLDTEEGKDCVSRIEQRSANCVVFDNENYQVEKDIQNGIERMSKFQLVGINVGEKESAVRERIELKPCRSETDEYRRKISFYAGETYIHYNFYVETEDGAPTPENSFYFFPNDDSVYKLGVVSFSNGLVSSVMAITEGNGDTKIIIEKKVKEKYNTLNTSLSDDHEVLATLSSDAGIPLIITVDVCEENVFVCYFSPAIAKIAHNRQEREKFEIEEARLKDAL